MPEELSFKISSALKDIIGKDLITDDNIAVFELVKNSFDAYATQVDIYFENIYSEEARIIIKDNGKGMDKADLKNKWLFVAYSAKREGTEDDSFDYRDKIFSNRPFAGAKGIGRFSCDRLGRHLRLETTKKKEAAKTEILVTDWEQFEDDLKDEFVNIKVQHSTKKTTESHGTTLIITDLRSEWNYHKLLGLKSSLAKLINPTIGKNKGSFEIVIHVPEEEEEDEIREHYHEQVNGVVKNFIFEELEIKTTKIHAAISDDGLFITTELYDGGTLIYKIKEKNKYQLLKETEYTLFYLNQSAKNTFTRRMGLHSVQYGHVFLYKNGFRVYPYGEPGEDPLKVDVRKAQGYNRYIGNRELMGQIVVSGGEVQFKETSSRGDGLIRNTSYNQLVEGFWEVLRRLEKYVVDVQKWGLTVEDDVEGNIKGRSSLLLAKLSDSDELVEFEIPDNFFEVLEVSQSNSANTIVMNLERLAHDSGNDELVKQANHISSKLAEIQAAKEEAEKQAQEEQKKAHDATKELKQQISENLFLKSINTSEYKEVISLLHHVGIYAGTIDNKLRNISLRVQNNLPITAENLFDIIRSISFETKKILSVVAFATKAKFNLITEEISADLNNYVLEYLQNISPSITDKELSVNIEQRTEKIFKRSFKPVEINIIIDNLISNSQKAGADKLLIRLLESDKGKFALDFIDNGTGINDDVMDRVFNLGYTTTDGSGIGLFHVKEITDRMGATIAVTNNDKGKGVKFSIYF